MNTFRAFNFAGTCIRTTAETLSIHPVDQVDDPARGLYRSLGQPFGSRYLGGSKKHCGRILAYGNTGLATNTGYRVESGIHNRFFDANTIRALRISQSDNRNIAPLQAGTDRDNLQPLYLKG